MPTCLAGDVPAGLYTPSHQDIDALGVTLKQRIEKRCYDLKESSLPRQAPETIGLEILSVSDRR
ncbi:MAG: hypothetical protein ACXW4A_12320 [Nitrospira sp.]